MGSNLMNLDITGIKLDEICTPNPFQMAWGIQIQMAWGRNITSAAKMAS